MHAHEIVLDVSKQKHQTTPKPPCLSFFYYFVFCCLFVCTVVYFDGPFIFTFCNVFQTIEADSQKARCSLRIFRKAVPETHFRWLNVPSASGAVQDCQV